MTNAHFGMWGLFLLSIWLDECGEECTKQAGAPPGPSLPRAAQSGSASPSHCGSEGSMLYICKCKPPVSLNNYQLEILLMSSWSYSSGNCELTISKSPWRLLLPTSLWILWRWQTNILISPHSSLLSDGSLAAEPSWPLLSSCVHFSYAPTSSLFHRLWKAE